MVMEIDEYWEKKVKEIVEISEEYGYSDFNTEFWKEQPAGILSLILDIYKSKEEEPE